MFKSAVFVLAMKKSVLLLIAIVAFPTAAFAQILSVTPAFPSQNDTVEIIYDATAGNAALTGVTPVYAHAGLITNLSTSPTDWRHVQGNWGTADPNVLMTPLGNNKHKITYHIPTYYGFPAGTVVQKLAFVFRDASGSTVGRDATGADIYYDIYPANSPLVAKFLAPNSTPLIASGDSVGFLVAASQWSTMKVYDNGMLAFQDSSKQESFYLTGTDAGAHTVVLEANDGNTTVYDTVYYAVKPAMQVAVLPSGLELGINEINDTTVIFNLFAPGKTDAYVLTSLNDYLPDTANFMYRTPSGTHFWKQMHVPAGQTFTYQYFVDGEVRIGDPFSTLVLDPSNDQWIPTATFPNMPAYPTGKTSGIVTVYQTAKASYNWSSTSYVRPEKDNLIIYELLIRDFVDERNYQTLIDTLDYLDRLGINAIELMPNSEFEGNSSWGYNPSYHMALDKAYGTADKFKEFIDSCHNRGIAVIMDQVFNHAYGQNPVAQLWWDAANSRPAADNPYMNAICPHPQFCWGNDFDHFSQATKDYIDRINLYWLQEFNIDGIRFDFTKGFINSSNMDSYSAPRISVLKRMADAIWAADSNFYVILEHWGPNNEEQVLSDYGMLLWGNVVHSYYEAAMGYTANSDFSWGIAKDRGWADKHLISYMESHDEERIAFKVKSFGNSNGSYNTKQLPTMADRLILTSAFMYLTPGPKMSYMFQELGYDLSIDNPCRICEKQILWNYYADQHRQKLYFYTASLIDLRMQYPDVFNTDNFTYALNGAAKRLNLNGASFAAAVVGNFAVTTQNVYPNFQHPGTWYDYFTGDSIEVTNSTAPLSYAPGEWHVYTDTKLSKAAFMSTPEWAELTKPYALYPNPTAGPLDLLLDFPSGEQVQLDVVNIQGRIVRKDRMTSSGTEVQTLDLSELPAGLYMVRITAGGRSYTERIVKQ